MSRRSGRRRTAGGQGWLGKAALGLIVAGVLGAAILYAMVRGYLYSDAFRRFLSCKASEAAHVDGEFTPFRWDGLAVDTSAFEANGNGMVKELRVDGMHTEVGVRGLRRGVWELYGSRVQRMDIALDARHGGAAVTIPPEREVSAPRAQKPRWLPRKVELQGLEVRELVVRAVFGAGPARFSGMRLRMESDGKQPVYRIEVADGAIRLPFALVPELRMNRARLRYQDGRIFLNNATASAWKDGHVEASGEWDTVDGRYSLRGDVSGVKCADIFNEDWSKRVIGDISADFTLDNQSGSPVTRGRLRVLNGTLTALPVLDALAAYADTRRFRVLSLSEAHTEWTWQKGEVMLTNLVLASEGFVRLEGGIAIRDGNLDGTFRLGLAPGTLASIPGAETMVFSAGERGLLWAPLRITGTLDNPREDLTDRLVAAAGQRMFDVIPETGEKVLKFTRSLFGDSSSRMIDKGVDVIKEGGKKVNGILDGILGGTGQPQPK